MSQYRWLPLRQALSYEDEMERLGVSKVARSPRGFLAAYKRHGTAAATKKVPVPGYPGQTWEQRRNAFIGRHLPQYRAKPTHRRRLALIAWAYAP